MKKKNKWISMAVVLCLLMLAALPGRVCASRLSELPPDFVHDTCVFDTLYPTYRYLYEVINRIEQEGPTEAQRRWSSPYLFSIELDWFINPTVIDKGGGFPYSGDWNVDRARDSVRSVMHRVCERQLDDPKFSLVAEKERLARQLSVYGDTAKVLPLVYVTIGAKYEGDVGKYVNDLFERSMATNRERIHRFVLNPAVKRMYRDPGFLLAVSKLMFRLWEQQGRPAQPMADGTRLVILRSELEAMNK